MSSSAEPVLYIVSLHEDDFQQLRGILFSIVCFLKMEFDVQQLCHFCNALIDQSHLGHHAKVEQANKQFLWETFHSCLVVLTNFQGPTEVKRSKVRPNHEILMTFKIVLFVFCNFYVVLELGPDLLCCFC